MDVLRAERHRPQARAADLVDAPGRRALRQAGMDMRLPRRILPAGAVSTWPRMVSETSSPERPARSSAALIATTPSSCAGVFAKDAVEGPTGVRKLLAV
jgi:hypothetical protein